MTTGVTDRQRYLADISLFLVTIIWGLSFTILKNVLEEQLSPIFFVFLRFLVASIIVYPFCAKSLKKLGKEGFIGGVVIGGLLFFGFATQSIGIQFTSASKSAFITGLAALFVPVSLFLHKRKSPGAINGLAIMGAMFGMYLLTDPAGGGLNRGDFLTLLCAAAFGAQIYVLGVVAPGKDFLALTFVELVTTMILAGIFLPFENIRAQMTLNSVGAILFLGILGTAVTLLVQNWAQQRTSAVKAGLIFTAEPVFAYMFASVLLDDYFNPIQKVGGILIVLAVIASEIVPLILSRKRNISA
ncbi:MAG: DMT family transporter [candidate division Zixibacteria bacterium]